MNTGKGRVHACCSCRGQQETGTYSDDSGVDFAKMELARAYIKIQQYRGRWEPLQGLFKGTIFPELYRPYRSPRCADDGPAEAMAYRERTMDEDQDKGKEEMPCREYSCQRRSSSVPVRGGRKVEKR